MSRTALAASCIGLINRYGWLDRPTGTIEYGTNDSPDIGADTMLENASEKGAIDTLPDIPGGTLWHSSYIEIYIGNVRVMHAANTQADVIISDVSGSGFAHWFKVPYVTCAENVALNMTVAFFTIWWYNQFNKSDFMKLIVIVQGECICGLSI